MVKKAIKNPKGAGRKSKFRKELGKTTTFSCRVPESKKQELSDHVAVKLDEWVEKD